MISHAIYSHHVTSLSFHKRFLVDFHPRVFPPFPPPRIQGLGCDWKVGPTLRRQLGIYTVQFCAKPSLIQWVDKKGKTETGNQPDVPMKYGIVLVFFSLKPIN